MQRCRQVEIVGLLIVKRAAAEHAENCRNFAEASLTKFPRPSGQFRVFRGCCCSSAESADAAQRTATQPRSTKNNSSSTLMPGE